jgi:hypothetical protein
MTAPICTEYPALPNFAIHLNISLIHVIIHTMSLSYVACHALFYSLNKDGNPPNHLLPNGTTHLEGTGGCSR